MKVRNILPIYIHCFYYLYIRAKASFNLLTLSQNSQGLARVAKSEPRSTLPTTVELLSEM